MTFCDLEMTLSRGPFPVNKINSTRSEYIA